MYQSTLPGFIRLLGSSVAFNLRISPSSTSDRYTGIKDFFCWPMPCSALNEPSTSNCFVDDLVYPSGMHSEVFLNHAIRGIDPIMHVAVADMSEPVETKTRQQFLQPLTCRIEKRRNFAHRYGNVMRRAVLRTCLLRRSPHEYARSLCGAILIARWRRRERCRLRMPLPAFSPWPRPFHSPGLAPENSISA